MIALVLAMVWTRRGQAVTLALLTMFGVAASVAAPAYLRAADRAVAAGQVSAADAASSRSLTITAHQHDARPGRAKPDAVKADVKLAETGSSLAAVPGFDYVYAAEYPTLGIESTDKIRTRFAYRQDVCAHLTMTAGRCLIGESDIVIGEQTAQRLELAPGDQINLTFAVWNASPFVMAFEPAGTGKRFLISGVYRATDPGQAYWGTHNYFGADTGGRAGEPVFVTNASLTAMDHGAADLSLDGGASPGALTVDNLPAVRDGLARLQSRAGALGAGVQIETGIPALLARIDDGRSAAHRIVPVLAVCLVLLACLTIFLAVGYGTEGRRPELAVVALRGARWGQRWWLATGENLVAILAGTVLGCLAGQLLVDAFAAWRFRGIGADPGLEALRWAPFAALAAVVTALLAERRQIGRPVAELLRRVPPNPRLASAIATEAIVVLLAVVAVLQLAIGDGGLDGVGVFATGLVLVAAALVAARLLLPWATVFARRQLRDGRLAAAIAAFQLSRRPGGARLFALLTAAVAIIGYAAAAVDVGARGREVQAGIGTGAAQVVSVGPISRQGLLAAVRAVDPGGRFAMAAVRLPASKGQPPVLAVDTAGLASVAEWGGHRPDLRDLQPAAAVPVVLRGPRLSLDMTTTGLTVGKPVLATIVLAPAAGPADEAVELGELRTGRHTYAFDTPACAGGCRLKALQLAGRAGSLDLTGRLTVHAMTGVDPSALTAATGWRISEGGKLTVAPTGLQAEITSLNGLPSGTFLQPADFPDPLPVAIAGDAARPTVIGFDGRALPIARAARIPAVPGLGAPAVLADLDYADRAATDDAPATSAQVWLSPAAPADALDRLRDHGLVVTSDLRAGQVRAQLDEQGPALALWFYVIVAGLAVALAAGALILAAAVDRARRVEDLTALRGQGLTRSAVRRATLWTYPVLVGAAVLAGTAIALLGWRLTGWALPLAGLNPPSLPLPALPRFTTLLITALAAFVILAGVAVLAGRRTLRAIR
ncbi:FtsX-like permease family protein [Actinoplanes sp. NPDC026619]|uniref:FtsX-like permease family protein n=1 Tax=Actinoplanes sp. NPDC026619 TaxID=3155798 RepID=UPI0034027E60